VGRCSYYLTVQRCVELLFVLCLTTQQLPRSPLFPYTTLFRSRKIAPCSMPGNLRSPAYLARPITFARWLTWGIPLPIVECCDDRSEEHTSELQSRENLVCRLLLEKKNKRIVERLFLLMISAYE